MFTTDTSITPSQDESPDERAHQLGLWVAHQLGRPAGSIQLHAISSDAGFRRYFRFDRPSPWLAVDAPPQTEDTKQFIALARYLSQHQINTPKILAADETHGFLLVEDFGDTLLYRHLSVDNVRQSYGQSFQSLLHLQTCPDEPDLIPRYDRELLRRELEIFREWFVDKLLGYSLNLDENALLDQVFVQLENCAAEQTQTLVHRDFHSRNLLLCDHETIGVIDFQGALWGPCTYDLVSLLRDCYLHWPAGFVKDMALEYRQLAMGAGVLDSTIDEERYLQWFDWVGLQRHIKVLGIFARLNLRDSKSHYLKDLPLVIRYTLEVSKAYDELKPFADWFEANLLPLAQQHEWYEEYQRAGSND